MDTVLVLIAGVLLLLGIIGSILPFLPGAPISWAGLLVLHFTNINIGSTVLIITFIFTALIYSLQYFIPAYGTKKYGGSKWGMTGTVVGLLVGLFSPIPFGVLIGPFIGAFIGELLNKSDTRNALRAAYGSFIGFLASTFIELVLCLAFFGFFLYKIWDQHELLF